MCIDAYAHVCPLSFRLICQQRYPVSQCIHKASILECNLLLLQSIKFVVRGREPDVTHGHPGMKAQANALSEKG